MGYFRVMRSIGIVEGFFGPEWPEAQRKSYSHFLSQVGGDFYIYAPKRDQHLRKGWRDTWNDSFTAKLKNLCAHFHQNGIEFGVGLSPMGLGKILTPSDVKILEDKVRILQDLGIDILGLFFDDMPVTENLADTQISVMEVVKRAFRGKIIFCPSFYTPDPILDKVFGQRPSNYLEDIAEGIPDHVAIAWTGPKVISPEIDHQHLREVGQLLKRKPFIWENIFANDGPRNCKFLKLKPFTGRDHDFLQDTEATAFNLMNQPELSKILFLASLLVLKNKQDPSKAFEEALGQLCSPEFGKFILKHYEAFLREGLDQFEESQRNQWITELSNFSDAGAQEIKDWLEGKYLVGPECLTD